MTKHDAKAAVTSEVGGGVATVRLNRPDHMNAMNDDLLDALVSELELIASDPDVGAVVITGEGRAFCAGGDLTAMGEMVADVPRERAISNLRRHARASELLREMDAVTIAAVNGPCAGAGLGLALAADIRIAAEGAVFRSAFLGAAMSGDFGTSWSLVRLVGETRARELVFFDEKVSAAEALRLGLVSRVVPDDQLTRVAADHARRIARSAPLARSGLKRNLNEAGQISFAEAIRRESDRHITCGFSEDAAEAGRAFLERREPTFVGR